MQPSRFKRLLIAVLLLVIIIGIIAASRLQFRSAIQTTQTSQTAIPFVPLNPIILNGKANVTFPSSYSILANYSLTLINKDRVEGGFKALTLSSISSAQQHANSEMYYGYFSHWDTQGYKPYMRYTLLGGSGAVSENVALSSCQDSTHQHIEPCTIETIENAINGSEWMMMNNDTICCDNGHRTDILDPFHNRVSIGIAWNAISSKVYFVEDFENSYFLTTKFSYSSGVVTIQTTQTVPLFFTPNKDILAIYYDPLPQPIAVGFNSTHSDLQPDCLGNATTCAGESTCGTVNEAMETKPCEYWGAYDAGRLVGYGFLPCPNGYYCQNMTMTGSTAFYANQWEYSAYKLSGNFSLTDITPNYGNGVYTFYLFDSENKNWLSLSIFVDS